MTPKKQKNIEWLIKNYMSFFKKFGMEEHNIRQYYLEWNKSDKDCIEDYIWFLFNNLIEQNQKQSKDLQGFYERNDLIYQEMIYFRRKHEGKPANEIQRLFNYNRVNLNLLQIDNQFYWQFQIMIGNNCKACENLEGFKVSSDDALKNELIPYEKCDRKAGCTCMMALTAKRDKDGKLIFK